MGAPSRSLATVSPVSLTSVIVATGGGLPPAFYAVFGVFVAAFVVLAVVTIRWAIRRDRVGRAEWVRRRQEAEKEKAEKEKGNAGPAKPTNLRPRTTRPDRSAGSKR